jgi:hypothetical protein
MIMRRISLLFWCVAVVLSLGSAGLVGRVAAQAGTITEAQFKTLAISARTAGDHAKLAAYYRSHAVEHEADAKLHDEIVIMSRKRPADDEAWELARGAAHYAEHSREAAAALRELVAIHEGMSQRAPKQ